MTAGVNGQQVQTEALIKMTVLNQAMGDYLMKKLPSRVTLQDFTPHELAGKSYDLKSDTMTVDKSNIASIKFTSVSRMQGYAITFKTPVNFTYAAAGEAPHVMQLTTVNVQLGDITNGVNPVISTTDNLVQAGYNYYVVWNDGSLGIHNPGFITDVLNSSIQALK